jgi:hypothetical protein
MYTKKDHKEGNSVEGSSLGWKDTFTIDDKGGGIHQMHSIEAWFQGEHGHRDVEDRGMFTGGA